MELNAESVYHVESLSVYDAVMEVVVPLVGWRNLGGSSAGVDGEVILLSDGVNVGASFTTSLLYWRKPVQHIFMKKEQVDVECPAGCKHSFVIPRSLFTTVVSGTSEFFIARPVLTSFSSSPVSGWKRLVTERKFRLPRSR